MASGKKLLKSQVLRYENLRGAQEQVLIAEVELLRSFGWVSISPVVPGGAVRWRDYVRPKLGDGERAVPMLVTQSVAIKRQLERSFSS